MTYRTDEVSLQKVHAIASFFDLAPEDFVEGSELPLMWQIFFLNPYPAQAEIGTDGHPANAAAPEGMRRMFAGGRIVLRRGIFVGDLICAENEIKGVHTRQGKSGELRFVTHRSIIRVGNSGAALVEERDLVYIPLTSDSRQAPQNSPMAGTASHIDVGDTVPAAAREADFYREITVDPTVLFRFSALTYNAHRIHYDREYATTVEGYPSLVVHGPLQAVLMANFAEKHWNSSSEPTKFSFKLVAPLFEHQGLFVTSTIQGSTVYTNIMDRAGRVTAEGVLER